MVHGTISGSSERHVRSEVRMIQSPQCGYSPCVPGCGYRYSPLQHPNRHNRYTHPTKPLIRANHWSRAQRGQQSVALSSEHFHCCRWQVVQNQLMYCWLVEFERIIYCIVGRRQLTIAWYAILGDSESSFLTLCCQIIRIFPPLNTNNRHKADMELL